ncbi:MAG: DUF2029 domain-containing protein [Spirochaetes bacterium]|nr:DUF2029 domain-containing protein [Spirochaetota bacterium]
MNVDRIYKNKFFLHLILITVFFLMIFSFFFYMLAGENDIGLTGYLKGADYIHFYNGGRIILSGNKEKLYDVNYFREQLNSKYNTVGMQKKYLPLYSPLMYLLYALFAYLPFIASIYISTALFILIYFISVYIIIICFPRLKKDFIIFFLLSVLFPPLTSIFLTGHPSTLWLLFTALAFYFCRSDKPFFGGLALSLFLIKPNFYFLILIYLIITFKPRLFFGFLTGSIFLIFISGVWDNFSLWNNWFLFSQKYLNLYRYDSMFRQHSTKAFFSFLYFKKGNLQYLFGDIGTAVGFISFLFPFIFFLRFKKGYMHNRYWLMLCLILVLANPHIYDYDLIILFLPLLIIINYLIRYKFSSYNILIIISGMTLIMILFSALSKFIRLQISVIIFWYILIMCFLSIKLKNIFPLNFFLNMQDKKI